MTDTETTETETREELFALPASFGQKRMWLLEQAGSGTALYTMRAALRLRGPLDHGALERALTEVVARHEVLRSVLRLDGNDIAQVVLAPGPVALPVVEVPGGPEAAVALAAELSREPFDLAAGPLLRCSLLRLSDEDHVLLALVHHSVCDGMSLGVLLRELTALYEPCLHGTAHPLEELPLQYADYAVWLREQVASGALEEQLAYWGERLAGVRELRLPADLPRPAVRAWSAVSAPVKAAAPVVRQLRLTAPGGGVTASMVALAAYAVVLSRWSGQNDLVVGLPVAGRPEVDLEPLVGFFVNTLPIRVDLSGDPSFGELLAQVRDRCVEAYSRADVPFELMVERAHPDRRAGRLPLAQTLLNVQQSVPPVLAAITGVTLEPFELPDTALQFDAVADLVEQGDAVTGHVSLSADLFTAETAALVARSLSSVLRAASAAPGTALSALPCPVADARAAAPVEAYEAYEAYEEVRTAVPAGGGKPQTPGEHLLVALWREVLEVSEVGVHDEFYALGGNSMRAVRIVTAAREQGLELPLDRMLGQHTIREVIAHTEAAAAAAGHRTTAAPAAA
ncbi:condensation domain-containing protein [Streptomyces sp. NBC_01006]|uniref:condensation domain-containing protein n=1 Tax=Streptomyces sp. NBC_01006 TaxID=2903716 RepID=UPI002F90CA2E|nr:condensation domain-containing protein [Streptomyces sp. NBC_01006]